jgi:DNA-damage-inducible protein D
MSDELVRIAIFRRKEVRRTLRNGEWWFVITDVISSLTDSDNPAQYLKNLRKRDEELSRLFEPVEKGNRKPGAGPKAHEGAVPRQGLRRRLD